VIRGSVITRLDNPCMIDTTLPEDCPSVCTNKPNVEIPPSLRDCLSTIPTREHDGITHFHPPALRPSNQDIPVSDPVAIQPAGHCPRSLTPIPPSHDASHKNSPSSVVSELDSNAKGDTRSPLERGLLSSLTGSPSKYDTITSLRTHLVLIVDISVARSNPEHPAYEGTLNDRNYYYHPSDDYRYGRDLPASTDGYDSRAPGYPIILALSPSQSSNGQDGTLDESLSRLRAYGTIYTDDARMKLGNGMRRQCFNCRATQTTTWRRSTLNSGKMVCFI
jgi:hypothetical protein